MYNIPGYIKFDFQDNCVRLIDSVTHCECKIEMQYREELVSLYLKGTSQIVSKLELFLNQNGFLLNRTQMVKAIEQYLSYFDRILDLIFFVTEQCNFRCKYCYERFKSGPLSENVTSNINAFIVEKIHDEKITDLMVSWFGGEPTLEIGKILEITQMIRQLTQDHHLNFYGSMTTNGYLLTLDNFKKLYFSGVTNYQITLDGFNHDQLRVLRNGGPTFDKIINNLSSIRTLSPKEFKYTITIRHNILNNDYDYSWYDFLKRDVIKDDPRFDVNIRPISQMSDSKLNLDLIEKKDQETVLRMHQEYAAHLRLNVMKHTGSIKYLCYAGFKNTYAFRTDGTVMKCTAALNDASNRIGLAANEKISIDKEANEKWSTRIPYDECLICSYYPSCANILCPKHRMPFDRRTCPDYYRETII